MKKATTILLLLIFTINLYAALPVNINPGSIITDFENISKLFPHTDGSAHEKQLIQYISERLDNMRVHYSVSDFSNASGYHSFSSIIEAKIEGEKKDELVLVIPLSRPLLYDEAPSGILNIITGLQLLEAMSEKTPPIGLKVLFIGGEWDEKEEFSPGSRLFLSNFFPNAPVAFLYLNFPENPGRVRLKTGGKGFIAPRWLIERVGQALNRTALDYYSISHETQIFRLGIGDENSNIAPFLEQGYPALALEGEETETDQDITVWISNIISFINNFMEKSTDGFSTGGESHYQFIRIGGETKIISEAAYIRIIFFLSLLLIIYPFFARKRFSRYLNLIGKHIWIIPVMVGLIFLFLLLGTFFIETVLRVQNTPDLWKATPLSFFLLKISGALTLYWIVHKLLNRLPFSRRGNFYSATAIFLLIILFLLVCIINISFAYIVMWSLLFAFLFSIFRRRIIKLLCLLLSMVWLFYFSYVVFITPQIDLARILLFSRFAGNGFLALLLLPHIFLFIRLSFLFYIPRKGVRIGVDRGILIFLFSFTIGIGIFLLSTSPYSEGTPQPLRINERIDLENQIKTVLLESPAPFGVDEIEYSGRVLKVNPKSREANLPIGLCPPSPEIDLQLIPFLGRQEIKLGLSITGEDQENLHKVILTLRSPKEIILLDSNYPYSLDSVLDSARIHLGAYPPIPLEISLIVPETASLEGVVSSLFTFPPKLEVINGKNFLIEMNRLYITRIDLTAAPENEVQ